MSRTGIPIWLRLPVIPGVNDDEASVVAGRGARRADAVGPPREPPPLPPDRERQAGAPGAAETDDETLEAALADAPSPTPERMAALAALFAPTGIETTIGG